MLPHPLTSFKIQKKYQNEPKFNGVYSRDNLPKIKNGSYVVNLDEYESVGTYWIGLNVNGENVRYGGSFGLEHIHRQHYITSLYFLLTNMKRMTK